MKYILLNNLGSKHNLVMKFGQFIQHCKRKLFIKNLIKMWAGNYFLVFNFQRILWKMGNEEVYVLIWTNFDSFTNTYVT